jgi:uncharacterized repeat protein (TIGR01451 family)
MIERRTGLRLLALALLAAFAAPLFAVESALPNEARLSILMTASPSPVAAGANLTYTIVVSNEGPADADHPVLDDNFFPTPTTFVAVTYPAGWSCATPPVGANGSVACSAPSLAPESVTFTITVRANPTLPTGATITNTATIISNSPDARTSDNTSTVTTPVQSVSDLGITKSAPANVEAGNGLTYTLVWSAGGPSTAGTVTITDDLPAGTTFSSVNAPGFTCTTGGPIVCSASGVAAGSTGTITIATTTDPTLASGTVLTNSASIAGDTIDNVPANNSGTSTTTITSSSDLALTKSGSAAVAGGTTSWTLGYSAAGPSTAASVTVTDTLPAGTTATAVVAPGWTCTLGPTVTCTIASLAAGASGTIVISADVDPAAIGPLMNSATIASAGTSDPNPANNTATSSTAVTTNADLGVTIGDSPDPVFPGSTLTYTVTVTKSGPSTATNATLTVVLGPQTTFNSISSNPGWSCTTGAAIVCTNPALAAPSTTFTIVTTTAGSFTTAAIVTTAQVMSSATDPNPANNSASATTAAQSFGQLDAVKSKSGGSAPGDAITYTVVLSNTGGFAQADNPGDELTDVLPSSLTLISATADGGTAAADIASNTVHWNGAIPKGGSVTITINAQIKNQGALVGTTVINQATVNYDRNGDGTNESSGTSNQSAFVITPVAVPALSEAMLFALAALLAIAGIVRTWR